MNDSFEKVTSVARLQPTGGKIKGSALNGITHTHNTLLSLLLDGQNFHNPPPLLSSGIWNLTHFRMIRQLPVVGLL